jgi:V8-like Glu-specific endopeptidase
VSPVPAELVEVDLSGRLGPDKEITLFGHPVGVPLMWSGTCKLQPSRSLPWANYHQASIFAHQCDTLPSNSGSPVLDEQSLKLIGVHSGGDVTGRRPDGTYDGWNFGTYLFDTPVGQFLP